MGTFTLEPYLHANGKLITIYDPATGRLVGDRWVRDPFPGNRIPAERIDPVAAALAAYFLRPNPLSPSGASWRNNFSTTNNAIACTPFSVCAVGQFLLAPGTPTSDNVCAWAP